MKTGIAILLGACLLQCSPALQAEDNPASLADGEWRAIMEPLLPIGERMAGMMNHPGDPQLRQEMYRELVSQIATGYLALVYADPEHPDFWPWFNEAFASLAPNPDNDYYVTPIDGDGVYKVSGYRGSVKRLLFQTGNGSFVPRGVLDKDVMGKTTGNYDVDDLKLGKDGAFEAVLSPVRPEGWKGAWWKLDTSSTYLFVRQVRYDWLHEVDGRVAIERLDRPAVKPRKSAEQLAADLKAIAAWTEGTVQASAMFTKGIRQQQGVNHVGYRDMTQYGEMLTQKYAYGIFDLDPEQALIVEVKVPKKCRYWSIHLLDDFGFTIDWMNRQSSINGFTAKVDGDGVFRAVISARDPGVPNWLDNAGYKTGAIQVRWEQCGSFPAEHFTKVVETAQARKYLPADTPLVTAEARDAAIRLRRKGAQMRKRW